MKQTIVAVGITAATALAGLLACSPSAQEAGNEQAAEAGVDTLPQTVTSASPADVLLVNARVYTLAWGDPAGDGTLAPDAPYHDGWHPDAQAVGVQGDRIVFVGSNEEAAQWRGPQTRQIDLQGASVIPGLVDSHTHVFNLGQALSRVSLFGVDTEQEAVARVAERARSVPAGQWIVGQGWDEGAWANRYPDKILLSAAVPEHPVFMRSLHSFGGWANQMALDRAGITAQSEVPSGGEVRMGQDGRPNGLLLNRAVELLEQVIPAPTEAQLTEQVLSAMQQMASDGFVTVHDAGLHAQELDILQRLNARDALPLRVYAMLSIRDEPLVKHWLSRGPQTGASDWLVVRSIKAFYDGALGSRGARLLEDYTDLTGHRGVSGGEYGFDQSLTLALMQAGFQLGIHAIGDAGNRETLDFLQAAFQASPNTVSGRHRIEHAQVLHRDDLPRLARLQVIASMEPPHAVEDMPWAEQRLGPQRILGAYAWRSLRQSGAKVIFNSDNPGSDHNIFYGMHSAVTRRDRQAHPADGWYSDQALNMDETLRAYSRWAAFAAFREEHTGIIAEGRWADLTVMDIDPFVLAQQAPGQLLGGQIKLTMVGGRVVFLADE